jgi:hypothetical protein
MTTGHHKGIRQFFETAVASRVSIQVIVVLERIDLHPENLTILN